MRIEFEIEEGTIQGIDTIEVEGDELYVSGCYDAIANWEASVTLTKEQKDRLAAALETDRIAALEQEVQKLRRALDKALDALMASPFWRAFAEDAAEGR